MSLLSQMVLIEKHGLRVDLEALDATERGAGGFGSTGSGAA